MDKLWETFIKIRNVYLNYMGWSFIMMGGFAILVAIYGILFIEKDWVQLGMLITYGLGSTCLGKVALIWCKKSTEYLNGNN